MPRLWGIPWVRVTPAGLSGQPDAALRWGGAKTPVIPGLPGDFDALESAIHTQCRRRSP